MKAPEAPKTYCYFKEKCLGRYTKNARSVFQEDEYLSDWHLFTNKWVVHNFWAKEIWEMYMSSLIM